MRSLLVQMWVVVLIAVAVGVAARGGTDPQGPDTAPPAADSPAPGKSGDSFDPAGVVLLPAEAPPSGAEREFSTDFSRHTIAYVEVLSGGPPKDGIPSVDRPVAVSVAEADAWLQPAEPVVAVERNGLVRAYPIQVLTWHEIINDELGGAPVAVTFCPLCNTGITFDRSFDGQVLDFGTTGRLRFSNLLMYDRQSETWWQQATGAGVVGQYAGAQLRFIASPMLSWADFKAAYPEATVVSRQTGHNRPYGSNPYLGYDRVGSSPFLYRGPAVHPQLPAMARVLSVELAGEAVAYPYSVLSDQLAVNDTVGGQPVVAIWSAGTASALDAQQIAAGRDVGAGQAYLRVVDGQLLEFRAAAGGVQDLQTNSQWDLLGRAISGPLQGTQLEAVVSVNHFWFSWVAFKPQTRVFQP